MSSRQAFYLHVFVLLVAILMGMSERYPSLAWAQLLAILVIPSIPANIALPVVILVLATKERRSPGRIAAAVALSVVLSIAWFFALLPLV